MSKRKRKAKPKPVGQCKYAGFARVIENPYEYVDVWQRCGLVEGHEGSHAWDSLTGWKAFRS